MRRLSCRNEMVEVHLYMCYSYFHRSAVNRARRNSRHSETDERVRTDRAVSRHRCPTRLTTLRFVGLFRLLLRYLHCGAKNCTILFL